MAEPVDPLMLAAFGVTQADVDALKALEDANGYTAGMAAFKQEQEEFLAFLKNRYELLVDEKMAKMIEEEVMKLAFKKHGVGEVTEVEQTDLTKVASKEEFTKDDEADLAAENAAADKE
jgi:hypothetical protein